MTPPGPGPAIGLTQFQPGTPGRSLGGNALSDSFPHFSSVRNGAQRSAFPLARGAGLRLRNGKREPLGCGTDQERYNEKRTSKWMSFFGASDEARTRYLHLGKVALYQMSYTRDNKKDDTRYHPFCQHKIQSFSKKRFLIPPRFPDRRGRGRWTRYSPDPSSAGRCTASGAGPGGGTGPTGGDSRGRWPQ